MSAIPQGLLDAVTATQAAKDDADAALAAVNQAAAAVRAAQSASDAALADADAKFQALDAKRVQVEALLDAYFRPGAAAPAADAPPAPPK